MQSIFTAGDPTRSAALGVCLLVMGLIALAALVPWRALGARRTSWRMRWAPLPMLVLAVAYELLIPRGVESRADLFLVLPMYLVVLIASALRWYGAAHRHRARGGAP